jgi:hypothetical protein
MTYADPDLDLRTLTTMKAMMAAATHAKEHGAGSERYQIEKPRS